MEDKDTDNRPIDDRPIRLDGRTVARAIIRHDRKQAIESANAAASHVSTPDDIQFCTFSDGSHSNDTENWGGVALAYRQNWLPQGWAAEREATYCGGLIVESAWSFVPSDMVAKAWPFGYAVGSLVMEGVGVLESLHAANEELDTVVVRAMTDCQELLQYTSKATLTASQAKRLPRRLVKHMHDLILALQDHGIPVVVELHWCPRNSVPQLLTADALAGEAMRSGLGYCNVTQNFWSKAMESVTMKQLEPMLSEAVRFARVVVDEEIKNLKTRRGKKAGEKRKAEEEWEESERRPRKKSRRSKAQPRKQHRPTMPATWGLDAETTTVFTSGPGGIHSEIPVRHAP
ncbi:hypothetical protein INS49_004476 [Diaporthe citri]|uniref:uncharacterized protein n=1 Tax=Diaporthe citri TaxID=83186 RepID=UPI001C7F4528|nr:uncharacterized protein INS49_004476 [Diaporthe citri]KAG6354459.1 hypothetical protein INS49_004476 [Diaporthe citri]